MKQLSIAIDEDGNAWFRAEGNTVKVEASEDVRKVFGEYYDWAIRQQRCSFLAKPRVAVPPEGVVADLVNPGTADDGNAIGTELGLYVEPEDEPSMPVDSDGFEAER